MNKKMTMVVALAAVMSCGVCLARPHGGPGGFGGPRPAMHHGGGFGHRPPPPPPRHHHGHHGSAWGRGGRNFWPGFVGGIIGGVVADAVVSPAPVVVHTPVVTTPVVTTPVVTTPAYVTQRVWVDGRYVNQVQPNGTVIRVWEPGHYEDRQVLMQ